MTEHLTLFVPGKAITQGSMKSFGPKGGITHSNPELGFWRMRIAAYAREAMDASGMTFPLDGPVGIRLDFVLERPAYHFGTGKNSKVLTPSAPKYPKTKDLDKLTRAVFDALSVDVPVIPDDGNIVWLKATKHYDGPTWPGGIGVHITLGIMP